MITPDELFLRTIEDLGRRADSSDEYELLIAAGLLRKVLLDSIPLMDEVNRSRKLKIKFRIAFRGPEPRGGDPPPLLWALPSGLDPAAREPGSAIAVRNVSRSSFLNRPVSTYNGEVATVHDLIDYFAHVRGAVHLDQPATDKEHALADLEAYGWTEGVPLILEVMRSIIRVVLTAMAPLVNDMKKPEP